MYSNLRNCKFTLMQYTACNVRVPGIKETRLQQEYSASATAWKIEDLWRNQSAPARRIPVKGLVYPRLDTRLEQRRRQHRTMPVEASGKLKATSLGLFPPLRAWVKAMMNTPSASRLRHRLQFAKSRRPGLIRMFVYFIC